jgi:hypothetical protein
MKGFLLLMMARHAGTSVEINANDAGATTNPVWLDDRGITRKHT